MKREKRQVKRKRNQLIAFFSGMVILVGLGVAWRHVTSQQTVSAHPTNTITLDTGLATEYTVPVDGTKLLESDLVSNSVYSQYVQGLDIVPILEKNHVEAFGTDIVNNEVISWTIGDVKETKAGHYFVLFSPSGNMRGGLIKTSVYNKYGKELYTRTIGTLATVNWRINTKIYQEEDNHFLIGTHDNSFFDYTVSETATTAVITAPKKLTVTSGTSPNEVLSSHATSIINTYDPDSKTVVGGRIYYDDVASHNGHNTVKHRVPVGALVTTDWRTGTMNLNAEYRYSLETLSAVQVDTLMGNEPGANVIPADLYIDDNSNIYGFFQYSSVNRKKDTIQIFGKEETIDPSTGKKVRKRKYQYVNDTYNSTQSVRVLSELNSLNEFYFITTEATSTKIIKIDLANYQSEVMMTYPKNTIINVVRNDDGSLSYYGTTSELQGEFYSEIYTPALPNGPYYYIQGIMTSEQDPTPFKVRSLRALEISDPIYPDFMKSSEDQVMLFGRVKKNNSFVDDYYHVLEDGSFTNTPLTTTSDIAYVGNAVIKDDYSPVVYAEDGSVWVDITDPAVYSPTSSGYGSYNWSTLDRWLITGSKNGIVTEADAVKVHDQFDSNDPMIATTPALRKLWLDKRINRNPLVLNQAIDWEKLGFDKTRKGPQQLTYFVTDSQTQTTANSRWINKETPQTVVEEKYALDVQNFHIPLATVKSEIIDKDKFKEYAESMAWKHVEDHQIDEDTEAGIYSNKVTVNQTQLNDLQNATEARPYPVDVTYKPVSGVTLVNRVWVFVTEKNTVPNNESIYPEVTPTDTNGVAYYADDYTIPLRIARKHSKQNVLDRGDIQVYDYYDITHETDANCTIINGKAHLPTLADKNKNAGRLTITNMSVITGATSSCVVQPDVTYQWTETPLNYYHTKNKVTHGTLDVTIYADVLLHVRQIIMDKNADIVVPTEGFVVAKNSSTAISQAVVLSGEEKKTNPSSEVGYTDFAVNIDDIGGNKTIDLSAVVPEFYEYQGYVATNSYGIHQSTQLKTGTYQYNLLAGLSANPDIFEQWVTIYMKPKTNNTGLPQPYSWDYKLNDFKTIAK